MRQNISREQWDDLGDEQKRKLLKIMGNDNLTQISHWHDSNESIFEFYQMNIGAMIEFLGDDLSRISYDGISYGVTLGIEFEETFGGFYCSEELVFALWEAVKHKLKVIK